MRKRITLLSGLVIALLALPIAVWASHQFTDVPNSHTFHNSIDWLAENGITKGCNPPSNTRYCPDANVTRGEMAAFLKRLAENRVVDAGRLGGVSPAVYANPVVNAVDGYQDLTSAGNQKIGQLNISAPANGGFLIQAQLTSSSIAASVLYFWVQLDNTTCNSANLYTVAWGYINIDGAGNASSASAIGVTPAGAGAHTVTLCASPVTGAPTISTSLVATYSSSAVRSGSLAP